MLRSIKSFCFFLIWILSLCAISDVVLVCRVNAFSTPVVTAGSRQLKQPCSTLLLCAIIGSSHSSIDTTSPVIIEYHMHRIMSMFQNLKIKNEFTDNRYFMMCGNSFTLKPSCTAQWWFIRLSIHLYYITNADCYT